MAFFSLLLCSKRLPELYDLSFISYTIPDL